MTVLRLRATNVVLLIANNIARERAKKMINVQYPVKRLVSNLAVDKSLARLIARINVNEAVKSVRVLDANRQRRLYQTVR